MKSSDFTSKEISMLFHNYLKTDILIWSTIEIWSLRHQMVENLKSGTSINRLWQSELEIMGYPKLR
jgi:hypothetical protein